MTIIEKLCGVGVMLVGLFILLAVIPGWLPPYPRPWKVEIITTIGLVAMTLGVVMFVAAGEEEEGEE